jgi:hypothetical protein
MNPNYKNQTSHAFLKIQIPQIANTIFTAVNDVNKGVMTALYALIRVDMAPWLSVKLRALCRNLSNYSHYAYS